MESRLWGVVSACTCTFITTFSGAAVLPLEGRFPMTTPDGIEYQAYYDPNLDITWSVDANINGLTDWDTAYVWATGLTIGVINGWRLPSADVNGDGAIVNCLGGGVAGCEDNEMGYLYWEESITASAPGPFSNLQSNLYWTGTEIGTPPNAAMVFSFGSGIQTFFAKSSLGFFAWPVHDGDVGAIADTDGDGLIDNADNCILQPNGPLAPDLGGNSQLDTDGDGYGNLCDPDFNGNQVVDALDFSQLKAVFGSPSAPTQDLNGNGTVDALDFSQLKVFFGQSPGPSGLAP